MDILSIILLAIGLAMDCTTVSLVQGVGFDRHSFRDMYHLLLMAALFGLFQGGMPVIGFYIGTQFVDFISEYVQWAAMWLLIFLGAKMIFDSLHRKPDEEQKANWSIGYLLLMALATSIDAFATGIVFLPHPEQMTLGAIIIGCISFVFSIAGCLLSAEITRHFKNLNLSLLGGGILILIGLKIWMDTQI